MRRDERTHKRTHKRIQNGKRIDSVTLRTAPGTTLKSASVEPTYS